MCHGHTYKVGHTPYLVIRLWPCSAGIAHSCLVVHLHTSTSVGTQTRTKFTGIPVVDFQFMGQSIIVDIDFI
jgi:hypothetical protein